MSNTQLPDTEQDAFTVLRTSNVALLTTFRRNGQGVDTPVGIRLAEGKAYFTTWSTTGKVKRLANNPRVTLASYAKMRRKVIGVSANFHHVMVTTLPTEVSCVSIGFRGSPVVSLVGSETLSTIHRLPTQKSAALLRRLFSPHVIAPA